MEIEVFRHRDPATPTSEQLVSAARVAWANADKHMGRLRWRGLNVRDLRGITDPDIVALNLAEHLKVATRGGRIRPVVTVLDPEVEILNEQLVSYAGYKQADGNMLGDPRHGELTNRALRAGWPGGRMLAGGGRLVPGPFDALPLLIRVNDAPVIAYDLPPDRVLEVALEHPRYPWFAALGLRWYAVPVLSRHRLHLNDSVAYPVALSGFAVAFDSACRELAAEDRYDLLPTIARCLGLTTSGETSFWREEARVLLRQAVMHSFGRDGLLPPTASTRLEIHHRYLPAAEPGLQPAYRPIDEPFMPSANGSAWTRRASAPDEPAPTPVPAPAAAARTSGSPGQAAPRTRLHLRTPATPA